MRNPTLRSLLPLAVRALALLALVVHSALTLAYVLPMNPTKQPLAPILDATIGKYFSQNWSLFAPEPVQSNLELVVRCLDAGEAAAADRGVLPVAGWRDLSAPLWTQFQRHRFSAYDRLARPNSNFIREFLFGGDGARQLADDCQKGGKESCKAAEEAMKIHREAASKALARIGSMYCRDAGSPHTTRVAIKIHLRDAVPWSQRDGGTPATHDALVGVFAIDPTAVAPHIFQKED